jgi:hypothetical protein
MQHDKMAGNLQNSMISIELYRLLRYSHYNTRHQMVGVDFDLEYRGFIMKKWIFALAVLVLLSSCADFFTNSWGKNGVRDPGTIKVTASNVKDLLREAKGDTKTSRGILDKIAEQLKNNPNPDPVLQAAAITAANQASGLGTTVLDSLDILLSNDIANEEALNELLKTIQDKTKANDLLGISNTIADSELVYDSNNKPVLKPGVIDNISEADLTLLALTMVLAEAEKNDYSFENYIETWTNGSKDLSDKNGLSPSEEVIAAAANGVIQKGGTLGEMLGGLFK